MLPEFDLLDDLLVSDFPSNMPCAQIDLCITERKITTHKNYFTVSHYDIILFYHKKIFISPCDHVYVTKKECLLTFRTILNNVCVYVIFTIKYNMRL